MDEAAGEVKKAPGAPTPADPREAAEAARRRPSSSNGSPSRSPGSRPKELAAELAKARDLAATAEGRAGAGPNRPRPKTGAKPRARPAEQRGLAEEARTLADLLKRLRAEAVEEDRTLAQASARRRRPTRPPRSSRPCGRPPPALASGRRRRSRPSAADEAARARGPGPRPRGRPPRLHPAPARAAPRRREEGGRGPEGPRIGRRRRRRRPRPRRPWPTWPGPSTSLQGRRGPARGGRRALARAEPARRRGRRLDRPPKSANSAAGLFTPPVAYTNAVRRPLEALQAKIQELILNDALVDRDGAVPPGYKEMVEDYFRVLSEDLR